MHGRVLSLCIASKLFNDYYHLLLTLSLSLSPSFSFLSLAPLFSLLSLLIIQAYLIDSLNGDSYNFIHINEKSTEDNTQQQQQQREETETIKLFKPGILCVISTCSVLVVINEHSIIFCLGVCMLFYYIQIVLYHWLFINIP